MARPILLFCCHPLTGHITPVLRIAAGLRQQHGWRVAFLSSPFFRTRIEAAGLQFLPLTGGVEELDDDSLFDRKTVEGIDGLSPEETASLPQSVTDNRHQALCSLPGEWASLQAAAQSLSDANPGERILVVTEAFFYGAMPFKMGVDLCPAVLPRSVCISITAPAIRSVDLPPFGHPAAFDQTPEGHARLTALWDDWTNSRAVPLSALWRKKLQEAGVAENKTKDITFMAGANYVCHDAIAQVGIPSFEFPRSDMPAGFGIVGVVPPVVPAAPPPFPWWDELVANQALPVERRKKVVVVAQGTVETEPTELILPTIRLLADRPDVITIAILGVRGASLKAELPPNCRVADYLSYDAVLPYAALWVHNGGYGATMHGIAHGIPQVLAGDTQDKPENGKRVQFSGLGIDLATAHPSTDALGAALEAVLSDAKYTAVAKSMQAEATGMDCVGNVQAMILEQIEKCIE